ncbi:DNA methyltransferase [Lactobacillus acidophilus]|uniref:DNA methyltransferase n=1 Tax=Lactobacillus acidophilus TaxID=1579 RepID=UPI001969DAD9|nr:DNA methyltransferase [Lactobacillus acidophilus]MBN3479867.1 methylase [Lactobacillus acidophilus]MBN3481810.1 methylase [Lactobacillus acidophilus]
MDVTTQKRNAKQFIEDWKDRGREKQDSQSFWLSLLREVLGVENPENFIKFEEKVKLSHDSFIDGYIEQTHVMIEQKGSNKDLDKAIKQSDGSLLTPFQQAQRYSAALPYSRRPRWIVTCNFREFRIYDMEHPNSEPVNIELKDLETSYYQLEFLVDKSNEHLEKEKQVSLSAGELVGQIYDELLDQYKNPDNEHSQKSINQLCVRIVFCLYAEDAGIFGKKNMFHDYLEEFDARHMRKALINLFKVLDTKVKDRDPYLEDDEPKLAQFPYVNGGMFSDENIEIPPFTDELRDLLLSKASDEFDWSEISPTIFGAVFESTLNPDTRRQGGMHYTSIENIHKVIDPLFLDELKDELNELKKVKQPAKLKKKASAFQDKLANLTFFDPACGSGNFLTETYLQLRRLENDAIKLIYPNPSLDVGQAQDIIKVSIQQFYGIEINDFAVSVAKTALWIAESQMLEETKDIFYADWDFLPLKTYTNIHEGNALRIDWNEVIPSYACHYIMGNPPFVSNTGRVSNKESHSKKMLTSEQSDERFEIFGKIGGILDYVACWYKKAADMMKNTTIKTAFVATDSIVEGQQVGPLWEALFNMGIDIDFAYRPFKWTSEASQGATVYVVIVGFSYTKKNKPKFIFDNQKILECSYINAYLLDADNIIIKSRSTPLCKVKSMKSGGKPVEGGYLIFNKKEKEEFVKKEPKSSKFFRPFTNGKSFIDNKMKWCLWLVDATPKEISQMPLVKKQIEKVRKFRLSSSKKATRDGAQFPYRFMEIKQPKEDYLIIPLTTSRNRRYIPIGYVSKDVIVNNGASFVPDASLYDLGVLTSNMHMAWMRTVCGYFGPSYRYSNRIVYNNFPWPSATDKQKEKIEKTAQAILDARALYPDSSLADLYDPLTMPKELLKAHQDNDRAVMEAYGLPVKGTTESDAVAYLFKMYEKLTEEK